MDKRSTSILIQLAEADHYITINEFANSLNVSRRTIYNDLEKINYWLEKTQNSQIQKVRGRGLHISEDDKPLICSTFYFGESSYYEFSKDERLSWIYLLLSADFNHLYFIETFQSIFKVSRNTVIDDIKQLRSDVKTHNLSIKSDLKLGYHILGSEHQIRNRIMKYIQNLKLNISDILERSSDNFPSPETSVSFFDAYDFHLIEKLINSYERNTGTEITDDIRPSLLTWLYFFIKRIRNGYYIKVNRSEKEAIESSGEFKIVYDILDNFTDQIPMDEIIYLTRFLLGAKIKYSKSSDYINEDMIKLEAAIKEMIENFQQTAAVHFFEKDALFQNLLLHMKSAYYRIKYHIDMNNPLKDQIKENYKEIYFLTKKSLKPLEIIFNREINDDELAYITIHFGGWLKRNDLSVDKRILRVLLVCTNGIGTSRIMENQMINLLPEYEIVSLYSENDYNGANDLFNKIDFVVSSIPLGDKGVPVIVVNPLFSKKDKEKLLSHGMLNDYFYKTNKTPGAETLIDIIERYADIHDLHSLRKEISDYLSPEINLEPINQKQNLKELLPISRIRVIDNIEDWESAINKAAVSLKEQGYIEVSYIKAMINIVNDKGPYMVVSDEIAFPHALPSDGVLQTGISLLLVKNGVLIKGKKVKLFIVLASSDNEKHLKAMTELTRIFSDKERKKTILSAENEKQIIERLHS